MTAVSPVCRPGPLLPLLAAGSALAGFVVMQALAYGLAEVFEYPLDDVYIHLAMAAQIAGGGYGVNAGEHASAASSALYPLLLTPFPLTEIQRLLPLLWNLVGVLACGWLWGRVVAEGRWTGRGGVALAAAGAIVLNIPGIGFVGMEHSLHSALTLAGLLGLWRFLRDGHLSAGFVLALVLAPLVRLEGLAFSLLAAAAVGWGGSLRRRPWLGLALLLAILAPVALFAAFLVSLGLPPVPSSVLNKATASIDELPLLTEVTVRVLGNLAEPAGKVLAALTLGFALALPLLRRQGSAAASRLALIVTLVGMAHLAAGRIGWMHRYEHYVLILMIGGLTLIGGTLAGRAAVAGRGALLAALALVGWAWLPTAWAEHLWNPRAIHLQQAQMARFAQEFADQPVAVNDLGRVVWGNPHYVLDLWGLASEPVRRLRFQPGGPPSGWADRMMLEADVRFAMVYERWIPAEARAARWSRLAELTMDHPIGLMGGFRVDFYALTPEAAAALRPKLVAFAATLPPEAHLALLEPAP